MKSRAQRSPKAGRPPQEVAASAHVRRRRKTATAAVKKDTMLSQAAEGPRVRWAVGKPKEKKR
ncbi:MAG: hypothetical protein ACREK6_21400 [Candidatus Rokuibacteriota bacterium]